MSDVTIIYCSSNREKPEFEQKIRDNILENRGDLDIISVSQKPILFGKNICVGDDVGVSGFNFFRQTQIACQEAKTRFVVSCEADCLYPPDYFKFIPERDDLCYRLENLFVLRIGRNFFHRKRTGATHAQIINREFYLKRLEYLFSGSPKWSATEKNFPKERRKGEDVFNKNQIEYYRIENPVVQIKTRDSMRHYTACFEDEKYEYLPYWGTVKNMKEKFLCPT